jgi:outer membrane protein OmpA-like peptidoglycan-associated protein
MLVLGLLTTPVAAMAQPFQGLYVGAGAGLYWPNGINVTTPAPTVPRVRIEPSLGFGAVGSVGYALGNGIRFEVEGDYRQANTNHGQGPGVPSFGGNLHTYGVMANALFDMDIGVPWLYPYVGAGAGYAWSHLNNFTMIPTALPLGGVTSSGTQGSFAFQGIAGLAFPIPNVPGLSFTAEYRFFGTTAQESFPSTITPVGTPVSLKLNQQYSSNFLFGVRYAFNVARPQPVAAPTPAPVVAPARSYLVFFDWDKATLTDRARQIVKEAADNSTHVQYTRIEVNGYTDTSGTPQYNEGLSVRRAKAVQAELIKDGVPGNAITIQGYGETHLLVPTGPGVREPQNRRVEIVIR